MDLTKLTKTHQHQVILFADVSTKCALSIQARQRQITALYCRNRNATQHAECQFGTIRRLAVSPNASTPLSNRLRTQITDCKWRARPCAKIGSWIRINIRAGEGVGQPHDAHERGEWREWGDVT